MAKQPDSKKDEIKSPPPTKGSAFMTGIFLFGAILSPAGVFLFYNLRMWEKLHVKMLPTLTVGCLTGFAIAIIPAYIFMFLAMRKLKKRK